MKVLFIHNTIPEYREKFFKGLKRIIDVDFVFTKIELNKEIYGKEINKDNLLNEIILCKGIKRYKILFKKIRNSKYDYCVLPPMDTFSDLVDCIAIVIICKFIGVEMAYFGEKWEAPRENQPVKKYLKNLIQRNAFRFILFFVNKVIVSGTKSKEYFKMLGISEDKIFIAIDASGVNKKNKSKDIRLIKKIDKQSKIILYYGRIIKRKGLDILIKAFNEIYLENNNIYLIICGDGPFKKECELLVTRLKANNIIFEGYVDPNEKYNYFSECDIFVLPSYFYNGTVEAWGLTVNEALECGKPVIATNAVGAAFDLINGKNGKMIKENNVEELKYALKEFLTKKKTEIYSEAIYTYNKYDYDNMVNCFVEALRK